jgi:ABC-type transporter Mla subunit MlaD
VLTGLFIMAKNMVVGFKKHFVMRKQLSVLLPFAIMILFASCNEMSKRVEDKLNELTNKANSLDTLINKELDKVKALDSILNRESDKVKVLDSLINKSTFKLDSVVNEKIKIIK